MSVAMWNCHYWPLDVSSKVKLTCLTIRCQYREYISESEHFIWKFGSQCELHLKLAGYIWQVISELHLKIWTHISSWSLHLTSFRGIYLNLNTSSENLDLSVHFIWNWGGYIWQLIWVLHLKIWTHISSWSLHLTISGGEILKLPFWPLHVSSKVQLPFVTTRWRWQYEIAILDH